MPSFHPPRNSLTRLHQVRRPTSLQIRPFTSSTSDLSPSSFPNMSSRTTEQGKLKVSLRGPAILNNPRFNKGSAFSREERDRLGLRGRLPFAVDALDEQVERAYMQYKSRETNILRNSFLASMKSQNWTLYYALLSKYLIEMFPIVYTPTEADAISDYSHLFRRSEGLYLSPPEFDKMEEDFLDACEGRDLDLIVVSDGEAILGIGDQGSGGIGISSAKAVIYTLAAGVDPAKALAVTLDVGTNNEDLLKDDLYIGRQIHIGYREKRLRGDKYDEFVDKFVGLVKKHQPKCLLHFEDFGVTNAQRLLARYRDQHSVFNDDIQGTGAVTLAALQAAIAVTKTKLIDQRVIIYGSGSAGLGIARQLRDAIVLESSDEKKADSKKASSQFWLMDRHGLIKKSLEKNKVRDEVEDDFIRTEEEWGSGDEENGLLEVVKKVKPTVLIGTSTHTAAFTEEVVKEMSKHVDRPIIFPLSNPTKKCEAEQWTNGKALMATGSPFDPVDVPGKKKKYVVAECNNALIYPGLGLGAILSRSSQMTDSMIIAGSKRLAELAPAILKNDPDESLLPDFGDAPKVNFEVALSVIKAAQADKVAREEDIPKDEDGMRKWAEEKSWKAEYREYEYDPEGLR
ncbi:malate dehydrogenase (oxaloacetate-decarboxylating) [Kwoniella mangroviensis CBS 10435]|uniref:Malate dehydrogenase (Oxaloacetate-decarboxylating) n=1 Tax=Kwoniella mangroviensis CBS 10435 TaxID=1331196 RepID=A0A1B9J0K1_9TREE|nr:malate dehydrogenase (oxaloacetate-decarboxylating) [Kwoniella mangroviensis CBS 10435]